MKNTQKYACVLFLVLTGFLVNSCPPVPVDQFIIPAKPENWYYAASYGSDSNDGLTEETPFKTLRHASLMAAGNGERPRVFLLDTLDPVSENSAGPLSVFTLDGNAVTREITLGGKEGAGLDGGGLANVLTLKTGCRILLRDITIKNSLADTGIGLVLETESGVVMRGGRITQNGFGVLVQDASSFLMEGGVIEYNSTASVLHNGAGVSVEGMDSSFTMTGAALIQNNVGGGVGLDDNASFIMTGSARVADNEGDANIVLANSSSAILMGNAHVGPAPNYTRGIQILDNCTVSLEGGAQVSGNYDGIAANGFNSSVKLAGSASVSNNVSTGLYFSGGSLIMDGSSSVSRNGNSGIGGSGGAGAGGFLITGNAVIFGNGTPGNSGSAIDAGINLNITLNGNAKVINNEGCGIGLGPYCNIMMSDDALVSGNQGGGINLIDAFGSENLFAGRARIENNTVIGRGGGVFLSGGTLIIQDNVLIQENKALRDTWNNDGQGGGIYISERHSVLTMKGGSITGNTAEGWGGGVFLLADNNEPAVFNLEGGTISGNTASGWGGGVAVLGYNFGHGDPPQKAQFTMTGGTISGNSVPGGKGGGVGFINPQDNAATEVPGIGSFVLSGGFIEGNSADEGGGVAIGSSASYTFTKDASPGAVIYGQGEGSKSNTITSQGRALSIRDSGNISGDKYREATLGAGDTTTHPYAGL